MAAKAAGGSRRAPACLDVEVQPAVAVPAAGWRWRRRGDAGPRRDRHPAAPRRQGRPAVVRAAPAARRHRADAGGGGLARRIAERAIERMRFALGVDDDYREVYDDLSLRPALRIGDPPEAVAPAAPAALGLGGAGLVDHQAADRVRARGRDPAPDGVAGGASPTRTPTASTLRDVPTPELIAGRAPAELAARDLSPARALAMIRVAREVAAGRVDPADPADDHRLLRDPGDRPVDDPVPGPLRPRRARLSAGRRPRLHQARRPPRRPRPPRHGRGGGGVLRARTRRSAASPATSCCRAPQGDRAGAAAADGGLSTSSRRRHVAPMTRPRSSRSRRVKVRRRLRRSTRYPNALG